MDLSVGIQYHYLNEHGRTGDSFAENKEHCTKISKLLLTHYFKIESMEG